MRFIAFLAACSALAATGFASGEASAQSGQRYYNRNSTVITTQDENGRRRTRVVVNRRSYLDGGTEILPGQGRYHDYSRPPYYNAYSVLGPALDNSQQPLPDSMDKNKLGPRINY